MKIKTTGSELKPRYAFAGNRQIGLSCLQLLIDSEWIPSVLLIPSADIGTYVEEMKKLLPKAIVVTGKDFRSEYRIKEMESMELDYIISVHFPYIIPNKVLNIPKIGTLNLHPSYLPFNKGWHTPTWAIYDHTPYGATLHWMDEGLDTGDIALQRRLEIKPDDTANSLYQRVIEIEKDLFQGAIPLMIDKKLPRKPQVEKGTAHKKKDLQLIQELNLNDCCKVERIICILRSLTTDRWNESAYFEKDGKRYRLRIEIKQED